MVIHDIWRDSMRLSHWGRVTHICVSKQDDHWFRYWLIWPNAGLLSIGTIGTHLNDFLIEIQICSFEENAFIWKCRLENGGHFVSVSMYSVWLTWVGITTKIDSLNLELFIFLQFHLHNKRFTYRSCAYTGLQLGNNCNGIYPNWTVQHPWWRHQIETFSALLAICAGNSPGTGEFPAQRPVTQSFDVFFDLRLNKRLSEPSWGWWFEMLSRPLWRHRNKNWPGNQNAKWWLHGYTCFLRSFLNLSWTVCNCFRSNNWHQYPVQSRGTSRVDTTELNAATNR